MAELHTFVCDVCGVQKRDVNHWWIVWVVPGEKVFCCAEFTMTLWEELEPIPAGGTLPLPLAVACGEEHAQQLFARWLVARNFVAPSQRPVSPPSANPPGGAE